MLVSRYRFRMIVRTLIIVLVAVAGTVAIVHVLQGCTVVLIKGNENTMEDIGGHGGGVTFPPRQQPASGPIGQLLHH